MCFTLKRLPSPPALQLCGQPVPYSRTHTFPGLRLDGPSPSWAGHVEYLRTSCKQAPGCHEEDYRCPLGCEPGFLLQYYLATIRPKLMYGSSIYGSAARTTLTKLVLFRMPRFESPWGP
ncbi:hypothetical protein GWK47_022218 [Chionoecetes opilio]|uniref:Uncharacterized protein n=1 Tax=Chionoecetes opilio TaxID=41210 RepID=A0A8J4XSG7_CHIOP|nr:hypothetical protein GWK47_022218 [Chionoecetes opilio]